MIKAIQNTPHERRHLPLLLRSIGIEHKQESVVRPKGVGFHQWFCCTAGAGEARIGSVKCIIREGDLLFIRAREGHSYHATSDEWVLNYVGFEGSICESLFRTLGMTASSAYSIPTPLTFLNDLSELYELTEHPAPNRKAQYAEKLFHMLLGLAPQITYIHGGAIEADNIFVARAVRYMEDHFSEDISIRDISEAVGLTPEYLCSIFKQEMGQTLISSLTIVRISHARNMLAQYPEKHAAEIGAMCGFQSPSYFGTVFKKVCGITPNQYRLNC